MHSISNFLLPFAAVFFFAAPALAQCQAVVTPSEGVPGVFGQVDVAMPWDPDGPGGNPEWVVVAGTFTLAGDAATRNIAAWDGQSWRSFGPGLGTAVTALAVMPNGDLVAAARFTGGLSQVLRWSGGQWVQTGGALFTGTIQCMATSPTSGDLWVGGDIVSPSNPSATGLAVYTGATWISVGAVAGGDVRCIAFDAAGAAFVGGSFTSIGGTALPSLARYVPFAGWQPLGPGIGSPVAGLTVLSGGQVAAFVPNGLVRHWSGSAWSVPVQPFPFLAQKLCSGPSGAFLTFTTSTFSATSVARWSGSSWVVDPQLSAGGVPLADLGGGDLLSEVSWGSTSPAAGLTRLRIVDTGGAQTLGSGFVGKPLARSYPSRGMFAIGAHWSAAAATSRTLSHWSGSSWEPVPGVPSDFLPLCFGETSGGDVLVAGHRNGSTVVLQLTSAGLVEHLVTSSALYPLKVAMVGPQEFFIAAGPASPTPIYHCVGGVATLAHMAVHVSGLFLDIQGSLLMLLPANQPAVLRYTAGVWTNDGLFHSGSPQLVIGSYAPSGDVHVDGALALPGGATALGARWNGAGWSAAAPVGARATPSLTATLPGGDTVTASGSLLVRSSAAGGQVIAGFDGPVEQVLLDEDGVLHAFGNFSSSAGVAAGFHAPIASSCPATVTTLGATCTGPGSLVLTTTAKPWAGTTFTAQLDGLPPGSLTVVAYGFDPVDVLLSAFLPEAVPGCRLLTTLEVMSAGIAAGAVQQTVLALPAIPAAIGEELYHQGFVLDVGSGSLQVSSSNALYLLVGAW